MLFSCAFAVTQKQDKFPKDIYNARMTKSLNAPFCHQEIKRPDNKNFSDLCNFFSLSMCIIGIYDFHCLTQLHAGNEVNTQFLSNITT